MWTWNSYLSNFASRQSYINYSRLEYKTDPYGEIKTLNSHVCLCMQSVTF